MFGLSLVIVYMLIVTSDADWWSPKRAKREVDMLEALCLYGCIYEKLDHSIFDRDSSGSMICRHADVAQLTDICKAFKEGKECLNECHEGPLKTMVTKAGAYLCNEHYDEFMKYTPCFTNSCALIENTCQTKCGSLDEAIHYTPDQKERLEEIRKFSGATNTNVDDEGTGLDVLHNINLAGACGFAECYLNCSEEPLTRECGKDTSHFLRKSMGDLIPVVFNGFFPNMTTPPKECDYVLSMSKEATKSGWTLNIPTIWTLVLVCIISKLVSH